MCEMDVQNVEGLRWSRREYSVPLPTPEGPEIMSGRVSLGGSGAILKERFVYRGE